MARARRRSSKPGIAQKSPDPSVDESSTASPLNMEAHAIGSANANGSNAQDDDRCPACSTEGTSENWAAADKESWVRCDACKTWFHWRCAGNGGDLDAVDKWFCKPCTDADGSRVITMKPPARKSARNKTQRDYAGLNDTGVEADPNRWLRMLEGKTIKSDPFKRMNGADVGLEWLDNDEDAMKEPVVIEHLDGLGMKMPSSKFTVNDVADIVGGDMPVEVIDVATQSNIPGWTLRKWADYYNNPAARDKVRNVISLEISGTKLADRVMPPRIVRELDWVEKFWPATKKGKGHQYPKVQLYCLMGVAGAWTDWHIDFAGSSVYYHILTGSKVFYFIRPTPANLAAYERWSGTDVQNHSWLGDMCDEVFKIELSAGNTMIIPTGWIHAVYTPMDTLVFGGNFLHSYNVANQLRVREIEIATHVPKKFRFPFFVKLCWYAGEKYLRDLKAKEEFLPRVLESIEALAEFLVSEVRTMERGAEQAKKEAKEQVPGDRVKDAAALARELRWRVKHAAGHTSDDEDNGSKKAKNHTTSHAANGAAKRKHVEPEAGEEDSGHYKNFRRKAWERVLEKPAEKESRVMKIRKPDVSEDVWKNEWTDWRDNCEDPDGGEEVVVDRQRDVIIKVRRTARGLERQRIERVLEDWVWSSESSSTSSVSLSAASSLSPPAPTTGSDSDKMDVEVDGVANDDAHVLTPHEGDNGSVIAV